jgi:hypothetical protein
MHRALLSLFCLTITLSLSGCVLLHSPSGNGPGILLVSITNPFPNNAIQVGTPAVTLNAVVSNDPSQRGVRWSLTVANAACSPECGTLVPSASPSLSAVYTPPAKTPMNQQATIAAVSVSQETQEYAFNFTLIPPPSVTITDKFTSVYSGGGPVEVDATVSNDPAAAGVTWTLSCSPTCGTLVPSASPSFSAIYTPPAVFPTSGATSPTITATSVTNTAASDSFSFTINNPVSLFKGTYSFLLRGYDGNQLPMSMAGTVVADGAGNLSNAEVDINDDGGVNLVATPQTGTYTVVVSPTGITQVLFEISSYTFPGSSSDLKYRCFLSADGSHGRIIELDGSGFTNSGTIELQDTSVSSTKPAGSFAFGVDSDAPFGGRTVAVGQLVLGASGVTGGVIDQSVDAATSPFFVAAPISADVLVAPDALGRGTLTVTVQGQSVQYAYYIVDASHFLMIEIDRGLLFGTVFAGVSRAQSTLTADSVNGVNVIQLTGMDEPPGTSNVRPVVIVGQVTVSGGNAYNLLFDINQYGNVLTSHGANGSVAFDPTTGRAVLSSPDGFASSFVNTGVWYLYDTGKGFFIEEDPSSPDGTPPDQAITNIALSGTLLPQVGAPFTKTNISGNAIVGFGGTASPLVPNVELGINFNSSAGTYSANGDLTSIPAQAANLTNIQFTGQERLVNGPAGYGRILFPSALFGDFISPTGTTNTASFYMIGQNQFVGIGVTPGQLSGIIFVDPE